MSSALITIVGASAAFFATDVATVFRLVIAIGTGPGVVLILRWFWWRINAWAELSAMIGGFITGLFTTIVPVLTIADFGIRLMVITVVTGAIWITVMYVTKPEDEETLESFYRKVRPPGPGWKRQRAKTGLPAATSLRFELKRVLAAIMILFGLMFATGHALLLEFPKAAILAALAAGGIIWLVSLNRRVRG
jgi:hypothetical protein